MRRDADGIVIHSDVRGVRSIRIRSLCRLEGDIALLAQLAYDLAVTGPVHGVGDDAAGELSVGRRQEIQAGDFLGALPDVVAELPTALLDAIAPARDVLEDRGKNANEDILEALQAAAKAARAHAAETRGWVAKRGRQAFTGERSRGTDDPGIIGAVTMMENVAKTLKEGQRE